MANKQNKRKPKQSTSGCSNRKQSTKKVPAQMAVSPKPWPKPRPVTRSSTTHENEAAMPIDGGGSDAVTIATKGLLGLSGALNKRKRMESVSNSENEDEDAMSRTTDNRNFFSHIMGEEEIDGKSSSEVEVTEDGDASSSDEEDTGQCHLEYDIFSKSHQQIDTFELEFLIPIDGATDSCTITSNITWKDFTSQIANKMNV
jgi:hypothetical protein